MRFDFRLNDWPASHPDGDPEGGAPVLRNPYVPPFFPFFFLCSLFGPETFRRCWRTLLTSPIIDMVMHQKGAC